MVGDLSRLLSPLVVLLLSVAPALAQGGGRTATTDPTELFERHLRAAREGPVQIRSQAAARLVPLGAVAADRLVELFDGKLSALAQQGQETVEVLGRFDDARLRALAWSALDDADFPWRPAALRGLAHAPQPEEFPAFAAALDDTLAAVRAAAVTAVASSALQTVDGASPFREPSLPLLRARLGDEDDRVRRAAAFALDGLGEAYALYWPLADLQREDTWFEFENGRAARYDAARQFTARLGDTAGYRPELSPSDPTNAAATLALEQRLRERAAKSLGVEPAEFTPPELPPHAQPWQATVPALCGIEVRSCRRGELFLAVGADDVLRVGLGRPLEVPLAEGRAAELAALLAGAYESLGETRDFGTPGCDLEVYRWVPESSASPSYVRLLKGPEPVEGLRPEALQPFLAAVLADAARAPLLSDLRAVDLVQGIELALEAVGGPL
ncbi:MAG: hypothetical protein GC161_08895 [Planctomycetaceae bacterium]|nr:hypothetical protein [Planctomycetaceae bacterium]